MYVIRFLHIKVCLGGDCFKHRRLLEAAQKSVLILILRAMKSTPCLYEALESELIPIDLSKACEELQRREAIKFSRKMISFLERCCH